jgi:hypothetical protein
MPSRRTAFMSAAAVLAAGLFWYAFWSPALRIASFDVRGASPSTEDAIRAALASYADGRAFLVFPRRGILMFNDSAAKKAIEQAVFLDGVEIRKKLPGTAVVTVREKSTKAAFERAGRLFALDDAGFVVRELSGKEIALMGDLPPGLNAVQVQGLGAESMDVPPAAAAPSTKGAAGDAPAAAEARTPRNAWPLILDRRADDPRKDMTCPGSQAFPAAMIGLVLQANGRLPDVTGERVKWFVPDEASDSADAVMAGDWHVYLATATPFDVQADRLALVLKEKIGARRPSLEYVDLRYDERIFFRLKDAIQ